MVAFLVALDRGRSEDGEDFLARFERPGRAVLRMMRRSLQALDIDPPGPGGGDSADEDEAPSRLPWADAGEIQGAQAIGGSIWRADLDLTHPLAFGYTSETLAVWRDHSMFFEPSGDPYATVAQLTDDPHLSGYVSDENEARLAGSPSVMVDGLGGGSVVLLIDNPNFRGFWRGTTRLFLNAVYFGDRF